MFPDKTCWHEAGHALAAHLLGGEVRLVTLESELDDHEGHVEIGWPGALPVRDRTRASALTALAGPIAELVLGDDVDEIDPEVLASWHHDWREFESCLDRLTQDPQERAALQTELLRELHATFADPETHEQLARIADMLSAHGTLDDVLFLDAIGSGA